MKISGTYIYYFVTCKRELWFFHNKINFDFEDENILIGRIIDKESYKKYLIENSLIDNTIKVDRLIKNKNILIEVKKSSKLREKYIWQLKYYLWYLKKHYGVEYYGKVYFEEERDYESVILTEEDERKIEKFIEEIKELLKSQKPPKAEKKPYCKNCSYFYFCWI